MARWEILGKVSNTENILKKVLENRGITEKHEQEIFLDPPKLGYWAERLSEEFVNSLKQSRDIILQSIEAGMPIIIHGDYDVDGVCATAILFSAINSELGYENVHAFIPNRFDHGYGLSTASIDASLSMVETAGPVLFVTVDSGITSTKEVAYIKSLGHKIVVTDHHQKPKQLPEADAILWNDQIVGASIAWLLAKALGAKDPSHFAYACLSTVTDLQPLTNFNRSIVKYGLESINKRTPLAFKELLSVSAKKDAEIKPYDLGWLIGPRLNASGRVKDAVLSLELLLEQNPDKAKALAWEVNKVNSERQDKTTEMYELASSVDDKDLPKIIVAHHDNYHEGIIGLVASKLVQKYHRPAIVISTAEEPAKGSVRSISGVNIIDVLRNFEDLFESLGGHPMAAGFSIESDKIDTLINKLEDYSEENITEENLEEVLKIDLEIPMNLVTEDLLNRLKKLHPHGIGNKNPLFCSKNVGITAVNVFGRARNHVSIRFSYEDRFYKGVFFGRADLAEEYKIGDLVDIAFAVKENHYNGNTYLDLILQDIKKAE